MENLQFLTTSFVGEVIVQHPGGGTIGRIDKHPAGYGIRITTQAALSEEIMESIAAKLRELNKGAKTE